MRASAASAAASTAPADAFAASARPATSRTSLCSSGPAWAAIGSWVPPAGGPGHPAQRETRSAAVGDDIGEAERVDIERLPEIEHAGGRGEVGREQEVVEQLGDQPGPERAEMN